MNFEGKPADVRQKQLEGDHDALREMGKVGGEHAAFNRAIEKELQKEVLAERIAELAATETLSPDGDVLPPAA